MYKSLFCFLFISALSFFSSINTLKAQSCAVSATAMNFGTMNVVSNSIYDTASTMTITCIGIPGATIRVCSSLGSGTGGMATAINRTMASGANLLNFGLYSNAARTVHFGSFVWPWTGSYPGIKTTLSFPIGGSATQTINIYGRVPAGQTNALQGTYLSVFDSIHTRIMYDYNFSAPCSSTPFRTTSTNFNVVGNVSVNCQVTATTLDFGSVGLLTTNIDSSSGVKVRCSNGTPYSISLSNGVTGTSPVNRKMTLATNSITYGIFKDAARSQQWGASIGGDTQAGMGSGFDSTFPVYGRVPPQTSPPPGTYNDTISVVVTY